MVAAATGAGEVELLSATAEVAPYDLEALTTGGRYWVRGTARADGTETTYRFFVKVVQSWGRSPLFAMVPEPLREAALAMVPWRNEPEVYRSDLARRLPEGLSMPRAFAINDLDEESAAVWLEALDVVETPWDVERHARAAYLLGRMAASPRVAPLARLAGRGTVREYCSGRVEHMVVPALTGDELWRHPLVAATFGDGLRDELRAAAAGLPALLDELDAAPEGTSHGDACTRNLLLTPGSDGFTLIDFGFWGAAPIGFDLSQLVLGEVQMGERSADELVALDRACLPAYVRGLRDEGREVPEAVVARTHALLMLLFTGLSALPLEHLDGHPTPERMRVARERAASVRFILDRVAATRPLPGPA